MKTIGIALIACALVAGIAGVYAFSFSSHTPTSSTTPTTKSGTCEDGPIYLTSSQYFSTNSTERLVLNGTATLTRAVILDPYGNTMANQTLSVALFRSTESVYLTAILTLHTTYSIDLLTTCDNKYQVSVTP